MNSALLLLLALMGAGGNVNPAVIQALQDSQKDNFDRWQRLLQSLAAIITTGIFYLRGMPAPVDAAGNPIFTNEALSKQISASFQEGKREAFWVALVNGVVNAILEFLRPSAVQQALISSLLTKPATAQTTTVVSQPNTMMAQPTTIVQQRTAGQVLRGGNFIRAQAVYFNPATGEMAFD
jgi:hypothetical protein